ncbi:MGMT family protein [Candidatus Gracilibacteria bacterium]|nr:MGMT family protein [Candidatus Gracilibacteria bacterium]
MSKSNLTFEEKVLLVVEKIPRGKTMTYGQVATEAGSPQAARAVGNIMKRNIYPHIPCHRVVRVDRIGGYNGLRGGKEKLLREEGAI